MDPYAGHIPYSPGGAGGGAHLQNQPQIVTNHYGSLNYPRNRGGGGPYGGVPSDNYPTDPEWQFPASHTMKPAMYNNHSPHPHAPNYLSGGGVHPNPHPPNPYHPQQHQYPANIHSYHQDSPNRLPLNIANNYGNGGVGVPTNLNHPDVAAVNNLTIKHTNNPNYLSHHPPTDQQQQHAVVRQLQQKFSGGGANGDIVGTTTDESNYGCEPDSPAIIPNNHRGHHNQNHINSGGGISGAGGGDGSLANNHHNRNHNQNSSSNGGIGGGGGGLNGVIPSLCCASEKDVLDQNGTDERGSTQDENSICLRSLWVHCRLSVLLVLVVILLILFLSFSGALLYFMSKLIN